MYMLECVEDAYATPNRAQMQPTISTMDVAPSALISLSSLRQARPSQLERVDAGH